MEDHFGNSLVFDTGGEKNKCKFCGLAVLSGGQWHKSCAENEVLAIVREQRERHDRVVMVLRG